MKYLQKKFTFSMAEADVTQEDWDRIFGKKEDEKAGRSATGQPGGCVRGRRAAKPVGSAGPDFAKTLEWAGVRHERKKN